MFSSFITLDGFHGIRLLFYLLPLLKPKHYYTPSLVNVTQTANL